MKRSRASKPKSKKSFDPTEIAGFNRQIAELRREVDRLNGLGTSATQAMGKITALQAEIKKLETQKQAAFDVEEIAACNARIEELKKEIDEPEQGASARPFCRASRSHPFCRTV